MNIDLTNTVHLSAVVLGSGLLGLVTHPIVKWARKEIDGSPLDYLVRDHARATVLSVLSLFSAAAAAISGDLFHGMTLMQIVVMAFPYGYANDSVLNKGSAPPSA